jgi:hypothetical protein
MKEQDFLDVAETELFVVVAVQEEDCSVVENVSVEYVVVAQDFVVVDFVEIVDEL